MLLVNLGGGIVKCLEKHHTETLYFKTIGKNYIQDNININI